MAASDPILGVTEAFAKDGNASKVNLGQGLYYDDDGKVPLLECVRQAESERLKKAPARGYLPIDGLPAYGNAVQELVFGSRNSNIVTVQALGGTGALKIGADFLKRIAPAARVWISDPSWENHRQLFEAAGFTVNSYAYYDARTRKVDFAGMTHALRAAAAGDIVVLHACCHNPTGIDLQRVQWDELAQIMRDQRLVPFIDLAYQGFGDDLAADAYAARLFGHSTSPVFLSSSFSKSFSLYGERVGALSVVAADEEEAARVRSQLKVMVRTNYSNPPTHGAQLVATVLATPALRALWEQELAGMRDRIRSMRRQLVENLGKHLPGADFGFILAQRGMFSYSGLTKEQVRRLRAEFSIYSIDTGRICIPALNSRNVARVAAAIAKVF